MSRMSNKITFVDRCDKFMAFCFFALIYFLPISIALSETFTNLALVTYFVKRISLFIIAVQGREIALKGKPFHRKVVLF